jgi:hypothetical protein
MIVSRVLQPLIVHEVTKPGPLAVRAHENGVACRCAPSAVAASCLPPAARLPPPNLLIF